MSRKAIKDVIFKDIGGVTNTNLQQADLQRAIDLHYLVQSTEKKNGSYMLMPPDDLPF
jgi:hypothetical protein